MNLLERRVALDIIQREMEDVPYIDYPRFETLRRVANAITRRLDGRDIEFIARAWRKYRDRPLSCYSRIEFDVATEHTTGTRGIERFVWFGYAHRSEDKLISKLRLHVEKIHRHRREWSDVISVSIIEKRPLQVASGTP